MSEDDYEGHALTQTGQRPRQQLAGGDNQRIVPIGNGRVSGGVALLRRGPQLAPARVGNAGRDAPNVDTTPTVAGKPDGVNVDTTRGASGRQGSSNVDTTPTSASKDENPLIAQTPGDVGERGDRNADGSINFENQADLPGVPAGKQKKTTRSQANISLIKQALPDPDRFSELRKRQQALFAEKHRQEDVGMLGETPGQTRTSKTQLAYGERGSQLMKRFRREIEALGSTPVDPKAFARWFLSRRPELSPSSFRTYKQGVLAELAKFEGQAAEEAVAMIENAPPWDSQLDQPQKSVMETGSPDRVTSKKKAKHIAYEDWFRLDAYLSQKAISEYAVHLREWLRAGIATGLRPDEWKATEVVHNPREILLFVMNAKNTNGRANGILRTLDITGFTARNLAAIRHMSDEGLKHAEAGTFEDFQDRVSQALYRADSVLFTMRKTTTVALYSCRHQFILNMRAAGKSDVEISTLVGHLTTETATSHYGKRGKGWSPDKLVDVPFALEEQMATVREDFSFLQQRRMRIEAIGKTSSVHAKRELRNGVGDSGEVEMAPAAKPEA